MNVQRKRSLDEDGNLNRMLVGDAGVDKGVLREAVDCGRSDDVRADIAFAVGLEDGQIDVAVESGRRNGLDLLDVEVVVDSLRRVFPMRVDREDTRLISPTCCLR